MADNARIDELRRRLDKDPASIAFAQLAEEHRRAGDPQEAVRVCRAGLVQHPTYVSARVTLGRALMELGQLDEAQAEFEEVLLTAPDNLVAVRSMAELYALRGETIVGLNVANLPAQGPPAAPLPPLPQLTLPPLPDLAPPPVPAATEPPPLPDLALQPAQPDALPADLPLDLDAAMADFTAPADASPPDAPLDLDAAVAAFNAAFGVPPAAVETPAPETPAPEAALVPEPAPPADPVVEELQTWLSAIVADRQERSDSF